MKIWIDGKLRVIRGVARILYGTATTGAAVAVVRDDHAVLFVRDLHRRNEWVLPGGFCRRREQPVRAAVRELAEETGLVGCRVDEGTGVVMYDHRYRHIHFLYRIRYSESDHGTPRRSRFETVEVGWLSLEDVHAFSEGTRTQLSKLGLAPT